jgi:uncharacterized membrane protein HdeD (DUF308 family)
MTQPTVERRRTAWDLVLGALLFLGGLAILANAAFATAASVVFLGWILLIGGLLALVGSLFRIGKGGFWPMALSGGLLTVLGAVFLRHVGAAAVTLTLIAGTVFLVSGIVRLVVAGNEPEHRGMLIFAGLISLVLGLLVLFNLFTASFVLLGILLGVQLLVDGLSIMMIGRLHAPAITRGGPKPA